MTASLLEKILCFLADLIGFAIVFCLMFWIQFYSGYVPESFDPAKDFYAHINPLFIHVLGWLVLFRLFWLYMFCNDFIATSVGRFHKDGN